MKFTLPIYYSYKMTYSRVYGMVNENMMRMEIMPSAINDKGCTIEQEEIDELQLSVSMARNENQHEFKYESEGVFHHQFMVYHREMFYTLFPDARPSI